MIDQERLHALDWQDKLFGKGATLPEICMMLRMGVNGSADEWDREAIAESVAMLKYRLALWQDNGRDKEKKLDLAIKRMVEATIDEVESYGWWQK